MTIYIGNGSGKAKTVRKLFVGDANGKARQVKSAWVGDANGKAQRIYMSSPLAAFKALLSGANNVSENHFSGNPGSFDFAGTYNPGAGDYFVIVNCAGWCGWYTAVWDGTSSLTLTRINGTSDTTNVYIYQYGTTIYPSATGTASGGFGAVNRASGMVLQNNNYTLTEIAQIISACTFTKVAGRNSQQSAAIMGPIATGSYAYANYAARYAFLEITAQSNAGAVAFFQVGNGDLLTYDSPNFRLATDGFSTGQKYTYGTIIEITES